MNLFSEIQLVSRAFIFTNRLICPTIEARKQGQEVTKFSIRRLSSMRSKNINRLHMLKDENEAIDDHC